MAAQKDSADEPRQNMLCSQMCRKQDENSNWNKYSATSL